MGSASSTEPRPPATHYWVRIPGVDPGWEVSRELFEAYLAFGYTSPTEHPHVAAVADDYEVRVSERAELAFEEIHLREVRRTGELPSSWYLTQRAAIYRNINSRSGRRHRGM
jgi:hypothetical protein